MNENDRYPQTFIEWILSLLEAQFPWLVGRTGNRSVVSMRLMGLASCIGS